MHQAALHDRFAGFVATLGRGPGRSRALTREEAREAFAMALRGDADPAQVGAFLMLLRYRGEDPAEIAGLIEAARDEAGLGRGGIAAGLPPVALDWPSYGAGRTRGAPWFLLAALALAQSGLRILMHGSNEFSGGLGVEGVLPALGLAACLDPGAVAAGLERTGFAYWPVAAMAPGVARLLGMRRLFGLRSPVNTVARLLDPADAGASVDGVFHPPYIALHLGVAALLGRPALLVLKGGGGEAERPPGKATAVHLQVAGASARELLLPPLLAPGPRGDAASDTTALMLRVWHERSTQDADTAVAVCTVVGTIAMALLALRRHATPEAADAAARAIWSGRRPEPGPGAG
ncbi:glycosyl transferase family protein [Lichenicoccus sp.]|uniref:glycosyl transferase family protein n=1 Tax=Lichenicoccus sp. TaxID=2781899 RepID=UPI003D1113B5